MASTFSRDDSNFIQIRFKDEAGRWRSKATQFRKDNPGDRRQAELVARDLSKDERIRKATSGTATEHWQDWVEGWMHDRYAGKEATTLKVYGRHWRKLLVWMEETGLHSPGQMSYRAAMEYRAARLANGGSNNTVLHELKFLSAVMNEAVRRGFVAGNPLLRMGLRKDKAAEKHPWTDEEIMTVARAVKTAPHFIRVTFLLGLYQAARMRQCAVPLADIDLKESRISYRKTKGDKPFTQPIDARLLPELREIVAARKKAGHKTLCDIPVLPSVEWRRFLDSLGLRHLVHHGLRVTWITRAATSGRGGKRGVFQPEARRFVNHGSTAVHQIYQRLNADDVAHVPGEMNLPELPRE